MEHERKIQQKYKYANGEAEYEIVPGSCKKRSAPAAAYQNDYISCTAQSCILKYVYKTHLKYRGGARRFSVRECTAHTNKQRERNRRRRAGK